MAHRLVNTSNSIFLLLLIKISTQFLISLWLVPNRYLFLLEIFGQIRSILSLGMKWPAFFMFLGKSFFRPVMDLLDYRQLDTMQPKLILMPSGGLFHPHLRLWNVLAPGYVAYHTDTIHWCIYSIYLQHHVVGEASTWTWTWSRPTWLAYHLCWIQNDGFTLVLDTANPGHYGWSNWWIRLQSLMVQERRKNWS